MMRAFVWCAFATVACSGAASNERPTIVHARDDAPPTKEQAGRSAPRVRGCFDAPVVYSEGLPPAKPFAGDPVAALAACRGPQQPQCRWEIARALFEANRYDLAGKTFLQLAFDPQAAPVAPFAAQLGLQSMNILATLAKPPREACFDEMEQTVPKLLAALCGPGHVDESSCDMLQSIKFDLRRLRAERLAKAGKEEAAGKEYAALANDHCLGSTPLVIERARCDELLYNAYRAYRAAGNLDKAEEARRELCDPKHPWATSELARKAAEE